METISEKTEEDLIELETGVKNSEISEYERSFEVVSQMTKFFLDEVSSDFPCISEDAKKKYIEQLKSFFVAQIEDSEMTSYLIKSLQMFVRDYCWKEKIGK